MTIVRWACLVLGLAAVGAADGEALRDRIDREIQADLDRQSVKANPPCDDATFLRRVTLDLVGTIPAPDEVSAFLKDATPDKRARAIDRLLDDPRHAAHEATQWDIVLFGRNPSNSEVRKREPFQKWLAEKFAKNEPYDAWVRELLLADGCSLDQGAPLFLVQFRGQALETAESVSRLFLGTQIRCARCHDHPSDRWTQKDFYGLAAFFARLSVIDGGGNEGKKKFYVAEKSTGDLMFTGPAKDAKPGQKGEPISAKYLDGASVEEPPLPKDFKEPDLKNAKTAPPKPLFSRKEKLAAWMTSAENPFFAKAAVNRVWAQYFGRGFVNPVDDLKDDARVSHPELFKALAEGLVARKFDLKAFVREIVNTKAYQRASTGEASDVHGGYDRFHLRALSAEEMMASLRAATGFDQSAAAGKPPEQQLPSAFAEYMVRYMGSVTDGRGEFQGSVSERLFMNNSTQIRQLIQRKKGNLCDAILSSQEPWEARVDRMFLTVLGRPPGSPERDRYVAYLKGGAKPEALVEESIWVLVNCGEFRFNH